MLSLVAPIHEIRQLMSAGLTGMLESKGAGVCMPVQNATQPLMREQAAPSSNLNASELLRVFALCKISLLEGREGNPFHLEDSASWVLHPGLEL
jgi:hypothetical protein